MARLIALLAAAMAGFAQAELPVLATQDTGVLRVRVAMSDASGIVTPLPRLVLLISDDPPSAEPRRVRTSADGTIELKLPAGSYTVELDEPVSFRGRAYTWAQIVSVVAGRETQLELGPANAEGAASARINADSATLLSAWRDSVVEIWTPTTHASGFIVDTSGLIATTDRALGGHTSVEVEFTAAQQRYKVPGRVVVSDRATGAAFVWVSQQATAQSRALDLRCASSERPETHYKDPVTAIGASVLSPKELADGEVTKATPQAIFSNMRIGDDTAGGPVFARGGELLGVTSIDDPGERRRWNDAWIVPVAQMCTKLESAHAEMKGQAPSYTRLPLDPAPAAPIARAPASAPPPAPKVQPPVVEAGDFDLTLFTSKQAREIQPSMTSFRTNFGAWSQYIRDAPDVLLVRVSPRFEESLWKTLARGAAYTQGVAIPPLKSFTANFLRMRAYCGETEVLPIHPFIIEHQVPDRAPIREGLYVFDRAAFGGHCSTVRFAMFSEKSPQGADTKAIDPKLFEALK